MTRIDRLVAVFEPNRPLRLREIAALLGEKRTTTWMLVTRAVEQRRVVRYGGGIYGVEAR